MELTKKQRKIKYALFCLVIAAAALLQNTGGLWFALGNARCFFLLPVCVILGLEEDEKTAALLGLFGGFLWDCVSVQHLGFNAIFLMMTCYLTSALVSYLLRATFWMGVTASAAVTLLYCLLYWLLFVLIGGKNGAGVSFFYFYLPCFFYTTAMAMPLSVLLTALKRKLNHETKIAV